MSGACETSGGSCETQETAQGCCSTSGGGSCGCGSQGCGGDPIEKAAAMWSCAFFEAMKQVHVDLLKSKIQKAWGSKMEKAADAVVEAMGVHWQSMLAQANAKAELRARLQNLWQEGRK